MTRSSSHALALPFAALTLAVLALPAAAEDAMQNNMMSGDAMAADAMMAPSKYIDITIQNLTTGQNFSPSFFVSRAEAGKPLFALGETAPEELWNVAEGGNIGPYSVWAAKDMGASLGDAQLAIHTLTGQTRTITVRVDADHPVIDGVWMLGMTNDGFSGFTGLNGWTLDGPVTLDVRGYDAGSEINSEKKGFLGALGEGNMRDPENGVIAWHQGIRGDADAPAEWKFDPAQPVARVTLTPVESM